MSLKIAYCIPSLYYPSGMERVLTLKANYFTEIFDYDVYIILTDGKEKAPYYSLSPKVKIIQLDINFDHLYGQPLHKRISGYKQKQQLYKKRLKAALCTIRPDITISMLRREINFFNSIPDGSIKLGEIHFNRSNYRDFSNEKFPLWVQKIIAKLWMDQLLRQLKKLKRFIVLSHEDKAYWKELNNVEVIHNPLSFFPEKTSDLLPKQVIAVGRYVPQKGFDRLIDAWQHVAARHPDWILKIYGDGMRKPLESQIDRLGLKQSCLLEHSVSNIIDKYCESSIFVLSSRFEGFGMVIIEAMACGVPPVSFTCPCGPRDIIRDGTDGLLAEDGNTIELAEKICYLIENEENRKEMGKAARENVERFKIEYIAQQWKTLFEQLMNEKK